MNIAIGGGGVGGVAVATTDPRIQAPRGALVGDTVTAAAFLGATPVTAAAQQPGSATTTTATYQWSITGGRILSDPRLSTVQFVADSAGSVTLSVAIASNGTSFSPTATVTILSAETAGMIAAPSTVATSAAPFTASVPAAQDGDRTFRWTVSGDAAIASGQGTPNVTLRPGAPGVKQVTCNVTLLNLLTIPVRAYVVVTGSGAPTTVTINGGSGGGTYPAGSRLDIFAHAPAAGQVFDKWTGDTDVLSTAPMPRCASRTCSQRARRRAP